MNRILRPLRSNRGQVLVEYVLLMVIAISVATLLTKSLVGRSEDSTGMMIKQWDRLLKKIGNDMPDCSKQSNFDTPNCPP